MNTPFDGILEVADDTIKGIALPRTPKAGASTQAPIRAPVCLRFVVFPPPAAWVAAREGIILGAEDKAVHQPIIPWLSKDAARPSSCDLRRQELRQELLSSQQISFSPFTPFFPFIFSAEFSAAEFSKPRSNNHPEFLWFLSTVSGILSFSLSCVSTHSSFSLSLYAYYVYVCPHIALSLCILCVHT
jgi:hypothetical protein